nr:DNA topoisomerase II, eukaryotic-type [Abalone asfa-like virus]
MANKYKITTLREHAKTKGMWAGALTKITMSDMYGLSSNGQITKITNDHTPALLKIFDEIIVNTTDHAWEFPGQVTHIFISFDPASGLFSCFNNGPGFPIELHKEASQLMGKKVYIPELVSCYFLSGSSIEKSSDCVKGGTNGIGLKLAAVHSKIFNLVTISGGKEYRQMVLDRLDTIHPPTISPTSDPEGTKISLLPVYSEFGYSQKLDGQEGIDINMWLELRTALAACYMPQVKVHYNNVLSRIDTLDQFCAAIMKIPDPFIIGTEVGLKHKKDPRFDIYLAVGIAPKPSKYFNMSVINGVLCSKGTHLTFIKKSLTLLTEQKIRKTFKDKTKKITTSNTTNNLCIMVRGAIPGIHWTGQRKDELTCNESKFIIDYTFGPIFNKVVDIIVDRFIQNMDKKTKKTDTPEKYIPAKRLKQDKCYLLAAEGDSALSFIRAGLTIDRKFAGPTFDQYGMISLGGIIINARKNITEIPLQQTTYIIRSNKLDANLMWNNLINVLGLDFNSKYETRLEIKKLKYAGIICCVDQDLDGCGKILSILLSNFHLFWPNLIKFGYIKKFETPVIRASLHNVQHEFQYEKEFDEWLATQTEKPKIKYYKGLATHDDKEIVKMFTNFDDRVYTFTLDDSAKQLFEVYFGKSPDLRKHVLSTPVIYPTVQELLNTKKHRSITCSAHLSIDTKAYKLDALERQLPCFLDGLTRTKRKVVAAGMMYFKDSKERKVFQFGGFVAEKMFYHHGDASLNTTIIGLAQYYPGAHNVQLFNGVGRFGTRHLGLKDAGSPRYVNVKLNTKVVNLLFPPDESQLLEYTIEDGERAEPKYFLPILPLAVLESGMNPSEGWKFTAWGRNVVDVSKIILTYLDVGAPYHQLVLQCVDRGILIPEFYEQFPLRIELGKFLGDIRNGMSYGKYTIDWGAQKVIITELPLRTFTGNYIEYTLKAEKRKPYITEINDYSSDNLVEIHVHFKNTQVMQEINQGHHTGSSDPWEEFLCLRNNLKSHLNFTRPDGSVVEFYEDYHQIIICWIRFRKELFHRKLMRKIILLKYKVLLQKNILRYLDEANEIQINKIEDEAVVEQLLKTKKYATINSGVLHNPGYLTNSELLIKLKEGTYDYILSLRERDLLKNARIAREKTLKAHEIELNECMSSIRHETPFPGASEWRKKVNELVNLLIS